MASLDPPEKLIASPFLFRFSVPCLHCDERWSKSGVPLGEKYRLPNFAALDDHSETSHPQWADVRTGWNAEGMVFNVRVEGKRQPPWCREGRVDDSDGLAVWISTRDASGIHRANRFCHHFRFLPAGGGTKLSQPVASQLKVDRAREDAVQVAARVLKVRSEKRVNGYLLEAFVPKAAMAGFDPAEHPQLGFMYAVLDRELGEQTLSIGSEFPYASDPSLWSNLELVRG